MEGIKSVEILMVLLMCIQYDKIIQATPYNSTIRHQENIPTLNNEDIEVSKNVSENPKNQTFHNLVEELYDKQFYNLSTCINELKDNLKGNSNLSLNDLLCKYIFCHLRSFI